MSPLGPNPKPIHRKTTKLTAGFANICVTHTTSVLTARFAEINRKRTLNTQFQKPAGGLEQNVLYFGITINILLVEVWVLLTTCFHITAPASSFLIPR